MISDPSFHEKRPNYPGEEDKKQHRDVEYHHDEEIQGTILNNRSRQQSHTRSVNSFESEGEGNDANEGN